MRNKKWLFLPAILIALGIGYAVYWFWGARLWASWQYDRFLSTSQEAAELLKSHYAGIECDQLKGQVLVGDLGASQQSLCAGQRAWFENDISFCDLHDNPDLCFGWMAIKIGDPAICELTTNRTGSTSIKAKIVADEADSAWLYDCYRSMANWRNDSALCDLIPFAEDSWYQQCRDTAGNWDQHYSDFEHSPM